MNRIRDSIRVLLGRAFAYDRDDYTDGRTPRMCREIMSFGTRFCELRPGHAGAHECRAMEQHGNKFAASRRGGTRG